MPRNTTRWLALAATLTLALARPAPAAGPEQACADCHGKNGASTESDVPVIGGLSEQYLLDSMAAYADKSRPCAESKYRAGDKSRPATDMCKVASMLNAADTAKIAKHLAAEPFVRAKQQADAAKAAAGKKIHAANCEKCHSENGSVAADDAGILAGQWMPYLRAAMKEFSSGQRPQPKPMKAKMDKLSPEDAEALVHYYGSFN